MPKQPFCSLAPGAFTGAVEHRNVLPVSEKLRWRLTAKPFVTYAWAHDLSFSDVDVSSDLSKAVKERGGKKKDQHRKACGMPMEAVELWDKFIW